MQPKEQASCWLEAARKAMEIEAEAITRSAKRLDSNLSRAVDLILDSPGKLVVTGLGKSGLVARKIVATLCSTGTPAVFLHAAEASHGDLGIYVTGDLTLMVSKSGTTKELLDLIPFLRELPSQCIGILGKTTSPLGAQMDVILDASVFFFSSRRRHTRCSRDWSSDVCSSDLLIQPGNWYPSEKCHRLCPAKPTHYRNRS